MLICSNGQRWLEPASYVNSHVQFAALLSNVEKESAKNTLTIMGAEIMPSFTTRGARVLFAEERRPVKSERLGKYYRDPNAVKTLICMKWNSRMEKLKHSRI